MKRIVSISLLMFSLPFFLFAQSASGGNGRQRANGYEYVDLGLSVKWATCNVGASSPEEYGRYFAWGDVVGQTWNGSWSGGGFSTYPRYELQNNNLKSEYDAAHVNWGGKWRMPTKAEFKELIEQCDWEWTTLNGKLGYRFTGKKPGYKDKSIFMPAAGEGSDKDLAYDLSRYAKQGWYWSSTFDSGDRACSLLCGLLIFADGPEINTLPRDLGFPVRPVLEY